jgi:hypothetical protein
LMYKVDGLLFWISEEHTNTSLKLAPSKLGYLRTLSQMIKKKNV